MTLASAAPPSGPSVAAPSVSPHRRLRRIAADYAILRGCLLLVACYAGFGLLGFAVFAGFWPPPGPDLGAEAIRSYFVDHQDGLRVGMVLMAFAGPFYVTWSVAISRVIARIEGPMGGLAGVQVIGGLLTGLVTFTPATIWMTAAYRADTHSAETIQTLYDFGWFFFDMTFVCSALQSVALGVAILRDDRDRPLFPAWAAWMGFLTAVCYLPLTLMPLFTSGPMAWNGAVSFWVVFVEFFVFTAAISVLTWRALRTLQDEDTAEAMGMLRWATPSTRRRPPPTAPRCAPTPAHRTVGCPVWRGAGCSSSATSPSSRCSSPPTCARAGTTWPGSRRPRGSWTSSSVG